MVTLQTKSAVIGWTEDHVLSGTLPNSRTLLPDQPDPMEIRDQEQPEDL